MKYAVVKIGAKQYKVSEETVLDVEKLEAEPEKKLEFDKVLLLVSDKDIKVGAPYLKGIKVQAEVLEQFKDKKIRVAKFKAKSRYRKVKGHRQLKTKIKVTKITS
jgi:large subunit ribosomal protein L21